MATPYAEVIGDPIAQSKSPLIHNHWLRTCGIAGRFAARQVPQPGLADYLSDRASDPDWRGCSVTLPHKEKVMQLLPTVEGAALRIGAVNCVYRSGQELVGCNTDVEGIAHALAHVPLDGAKIAVVGAGGAARAALDYFIGAGAQAIVLLVRSPPKAAALVEAAPDRIKVRHQTEADLALDGARLIVNASPLGMAGGAPMPPDLLEAVGRHAAGAALFDMVYQPNDTDFLKTGRAAGGIAIGGLDMLIRQARTAFRLFFGHQAPEQDYELIRLLRDAAPVG
nr:shikimate dehydrogenase [uncultured Sphingosinicella sp.]